MKENGLTLKRQGAETITDADNIDDLVLLANRLALAGARSIGLYMDLDRIEFMCFK